MMQLINTQLLKQQFIFSPKTQLDGWSFKYQPIQNLLKLSADHDLNQSTPQKLLKIAIVTETWAPEINGVANSLLNLCRGLKARGHQILLIRPQPKQQYQLFKPDAECWVRAQAIPKYPHLQFGWPQIAKISKVIDQFQPDVMHLVTEGPLGLGCLYIAKTKKIPISSAYHSTFQEFSRFFNLAFLCRPIQAYLTWFHNRTIACCVPSLDTKKMLRDMGVHHPIHLVGRGVNTTLFDPAKRSHQLRRQWGACEQTRVLISVGRLSPEKEVNVVIDSYLKMKTQAKQETLPTKLVIVGDGPQRAELEALSQNSDIIFMGSLVGEDLAEAYASADVFVFPSQIETFGNVALEALASGIPIIAYDYACAKLHVQPRLTGWLAPLGQLELLQQFVLNLPNVEMLRHMGKLARKDVLEVGWTKPVTQFEQVLSVVSQSSDLTV